MIVFDRTRAHRHDHTRAPFACLTNDAILQTLPRTVNTRFGTMFIHAALLVLSGDSLACYSTSASRPTPPFSPLPRS